MMKVHINGIDLAYSDQGQGTPLVFLHGFPLHRAMWDPQVQVLSRHYRTITIDLRGHGESDAPMWRYTLEQFADDIKGLLDHLSIPTATFIGLSMGGYTLFALFRKYPALIHKLILADTRAQADSADVKASRYATAQIAYKNGPESIATLMLPKLLSSTALAHRTDLVTMIRTMITSNHISGIIGDLMAMEERPDSTPLLKQIHCPTLVIVGEEDVATPPAEITLMAQQIPNAKLEIIPKAGHVSNMENPKAFTQALENFLYTG